MAAAVAAVLLLATVGVWMARDRAEPDPAAVAADATERPAADERPSVDEPASAEPDDAAGRGAEAEGAEPVASDVTAAAARRQEPPRAGPPAANVARAREPEPPANEGPTPAEPASSPPSVRERVAPGPDPAEAVLRTLEELTEAYALLDAVAVARLWPGGPSREKLEAAFAVLESQDLELSSCQVGFVGEDRATAACVQRLSVTPRSGPAPPVHESRVVFELSRRGDRWLIESRRQ